jgi:hypothetical protein
VAHQPGLPAALEALIEDAIRGDPCSPLRWVSRSLRRIGEHPPLVAEAGQAALPRCHEFHGEWNYTISPNQQPP